MDSLYRTDYFIDKSTGTPADALVAYGFAMLLTAFAGDPPPKIRLRSNGNHYNLTLEQAVDPAWAERGVEPLPRLVTLKHPKAASGAVNLFDYEEERRVREEYRALRHQLFVEKAPKDDPRWDELKAREPNPHLDYYAAVNQMSAIIGLNGVAEQWTELRTHHRDLLALLLQLFSVTPNPLEAVEAEWKQLAKQQGWNAKASASASQVVNPGMGKGINSTKSVFRAPNNVSNFWLLEYLKFLGAYHALITRVVVGAKDRKSYLPEPRNLTTGTATTLITRFQRALRPATPVKLDILAILRWLEIYLDAICNDAGSNAEVAAWFGIAPGDYVQGLWAVSYKDMGSALAVMNISLLRLPHWMGTVEDTEDAIRYSALLEEHRRIITALDESHSDAYDMLVAYRHFLTSGDIRSFFRFGGAYSQWILRRLEQRQYAPQFTVSNLEVLFMAHTTPDGKKLHPIVTNQGFQNVAKAIRRSTVNPQRKKAQKRDGKGTEALYEVRYGIGQKLLQKSRDNKEFIQELTEFLFQYNQENLRLLERYGEEAMRGRQRYTVTAEDIADVVALVDHYHAPTVAGLLVAFGYASDYKRDAADGDTSTDQEDGENDAESEEAED